MQFEHAKVISFGFAALIATKQPTQAGPQSGVFSAIVAIHSKVGPHSNVKNGVSP